jgi:hypothetical protein
MTYRGYPINILKMDIQRLIADFKDLGFTLYLEGEKLRYKSFSLIAPPKEKALPLLEILKRNRETVIAYLRQKAKTPELAYKIYSEILDACLWVVEMPEAAQRLRQQGLTEPIYTASEIAELKMLPKDDKRKKALSCIHGIKAVFAGDTEIQSKGGD